MSSNEENPGKTEQAEEGANAEGSSSEGAAAAGTEDDAKEGDESVEKEGEEAAAETDESTTAATDTKSGVAEGTKVKSQSADAVKSDVEGTKSGIKDSKSKVKSSASDKRRSSTGSKVESKASRGPTHSRSKVDNVSNARIGFLGAGRMTESIVKGLLRSNDKCQIKAKQLYISAKTTKNLDVFKVQGIATTTRSYDIFGKFDCDIIFLNMHGFVVRNCFKLGGTRPAPITTNYIPTRRRPIFILSLIGGIPLADIKTVLLNPETINKYKVEMHRLVLNTSVAYGLGLGLLDVELDSKKCHSVIRNTLQMLTNTMELMEPDQMDAACALTGNGMAFVYYFIQALANGGFKMGLDKAKAVRLASKTVQCAAQCLLETNKNPAELRDSVTSPSGGAIYGIHALDKQDCASGIQSAIESAYKRLKELVEVEK